MKRNRIMETPTHNRQTRATELHRGDTRRGSTIVVVLALVSMLMVLGFVFLTMASQEQENAKNFSLAFKGSESKFDYFDHTLRQIIIGPNQNERASSLYGGRISFMATQYGRDIQPFSGEGINLIMRRIPGAPTKRIYVDQNYDGSAGTRGVDIKDFLFINNSPAARGSRIDINLHDLSLLSDYNLKLPFIGLDGYPAPDVDYTYPDINHVYLSYDAVIPDAAGRGAVRVMIPSFMRPQILRQPIHDGERIPSKEWYTHPGTAELMLRPHWEHRAIRAVEEVSDKRHLVSDIRRFVSDKYPQAGINPFPFPAEGPKMGVWTGHIDAVGDWTYELDADPDNNGVKDTIYLDLNFPLMERGDQKFVAMAAIKIIDADGKFNLNAHGNLAGNIDLTNAHFGNDSFISRSNQGLSSSEVNPQWGLYAVPISSDQHGWYFGDAAADSVELANREWWWLLTGRPEFQGGPGTENMQELIPGRYGEFELLPVAWDENFILMSNKPFLFPGPDFTFQDAPLFGTFDPAGNSGTDDNNNMFEGGVFQDWSNQVFPSFVQFPAFRHPLDLRGSGRFVDTNGKSRQLALFGRHQWPQYVDYAAHRDTGYWQLDPSASNGLFLRFSERYQVDEPSETILDPKLKSDLDAIFSAEENVGLQLSDTDLASIGFDSRVQRLAPINFKESAFAQTIRIPYTTTSWDLKTYGKPASLLFGTPRPPDKLRSWEFYNVGSFEDQRFVFPPRFGTIPLFAEDTNRNGILDPGEDLNENYQLDDIDPFRPELRELLYMKAGDTNVRKIQRRLSINGVLDRDLRNGRLRFRPLTPHPIHEDFNNNNELDLGEDLDGDGVLDIFPNSTILNFDITITQPDQITNAVQQEYLARRDRQKMARDIYVLLYTLCGGNDTVNYTEPNIRPFYDDSQLFQMAQFAVNLVDALDPDDVVTVFEYDKDLSTGWNLDDNPFTDMDMGPGGNERGFVYGVEEQQLTFSEALVFKTQKRIPDEAATEYDDTLEHFFSFLELRNITPKAVQFDNTSWRIRLVPPKDSGFLDRRLFLGPNAEPTQDGLPAGTLYTIGTAGGAEIIDTAGTEGMPGTPYSFFKVKSMGEPDFNDVNTFIAPLSTKSLNLDLIQQMGSGSFWITDDGGNDLSTSAGAFLEELKKIQPGGSSPLNGIPPVWPPAGVKDQDPPPIPNVVFVLERRMNLNRQQPSSFNDGTDQNKDNPWIAVDRLAVQIGTGPGTPGTLPFHEFILKDSNPTDIANALDDLRSTRRLQPFDQPGEHLTPASLKANSLSIENENDPSLETPFNVWQPHFNRDFASVIELFNIPMYNPENVTSLLKWRANQFEELHTAGSRFLNPKLPVFISVPIQDDENPEGDYANPEDFASGQDSDNRWHRLLEFVEVLSRDSKHFDNPWFTFDVGKLPTQNDRNPLLRIFRHPGKLNLNTIQSPMVLGGLIDDPSRIVVPNIRRDSRHFDSSGNPWTLPDRDEGLTRNWWEQFLWARDGIDPLPVADGGTGLKLPGVPRDYDSMQLGSRPFRNLGFSQNGVTSIEDTVLRSLPSDGTANPRGLFEVGTKKEHDGLEVLPIDYATKHRLLAKVFNNATTRSNVFMVFIQIDFFEAYEDTDNEGFRVVRVGGKLEDESTFPSLRGFFVIDRSKAMESIHQQTAYIPRQWRDRDGVDRFTYSFYNNGVNRQVSPPQDVSIPMDYRPFILHREIIKDEN
jgi:hypothetical protein